MPRVLRIINRLNLGGPTYNAAYLTAYLPGAFETLLVAGLHDPEEHSSQFILDQLHLRPRYISDMRREINFSADRKAYQDIRNIIREFKPDIVHTHAAKAGFLGRLAAYRQQVPVRVHTFHGHVFHSYFHPVKTRVFIGLERAMAALSSGIIAISEQQKEELSRVYRITAPEKIKVIPLGFDLDRFGQQQELLRERFRREYRMDDDTIAVGIIGRLVPIKNHRLFLDAWAELMATTHKKVHAFIIGDGEDRLRIQQYCREKGILFHTPEANVAGARLTFTSWILNIEYALAGLDVVALTSDNEGTPVSLIEAQAAGKPIVTTDAGGIRDIVRPGETALVVARGHNEDFTQALRTIVENDTLRIAMQQHGPAFAGTRFSYQRLVAEMESYYRELLLKSAK